MPHASEAQLAASLLGRLAGALHPALAEELEAVAGGDACGCMLLGVSKGCFCIIDGANETFLF